MIVRVVLDELAKKVLTARNTSKKVKQNNQKTRRGYL